MSRERPCFTINACNRCRRRKAKCDPGIPSCGPCQRAGAVCEYTDPRSKTTAARSSILGLEDELSRLEAELQRKLHEVRIGDNGGPSSTSMPTQQPASSASASLPIDGGRRENRTHPDLIRLEPGEDAHFLGVSSGMHLARSVLESAQRNDASFQPEGSSSGQPTSASSPDTQPPGSPRADAGIPENAENAPGSGGGAASWPVLPSRETAISLIDIFLSQYEVQYPIVVGDDMSGIVLDSYGEKSGSRTGSSTNSEANHNKNDSADRDKDAWNQFILNMVFAIALVVLSRENPESLVLAKSFSAAAMADFSTIMQRKSVRTLQCLLFLLLWSILDSSSAPIWYISGLCMRMCVDLGFHSEITIKVAAGCSRNGDGSATNSEMDVKRRLFWVTYTFDRTLGTLLGRPFTLNDSLIDVQLPQHSLSPQKRDQVLHWFRLQQLQSQIVYRLYSIREDNKMAAAQQNHESRQSHQSVARWKADMAAQLRQWGSTAMALADPNHPNGHTLDWWEYWHQNATLLLHRPSPLKPTLDADEADACCTAAQQMIQLSFTRLQRGSADFAWVDLHYQLMSGITLLFLVWKHAATRAKAKARWTSFKNCLMQWTYVLDQLARQWERISRARDVLTRLVDTTIDIVEKELSNKLSASDVRVLRHAHASRISRNKTIIRQLGSPGTTTTAAAAASSSVRDDAHSHSPSDTQAEHQHGHSTRRQSQSQSSQARTQQRQPQSQSQPYYPSQTQTLPQTQLPIVHGGPSPPQHMQYEPSYGTPSSDTAINTSQSVGNSFQAQTNNDNNNNIYGMQVSPSLSGGGGTGQPISPQWITTTAPSTNTADHTQHPLPLVSPFHIADMNSSQPQDPVAQLLDQQAWHGLELYESFGAIPDNITMLDYFSAPLTTVDDRGGGIPMAHGGHGAGGGVGGTANGNGDIAGGWPDSLTSSILNFQTNFHDLGDFGAN